MKQDILMRFYLHGYGGGSLPAWLRRIAARSEIHRAWLSGFYGNFVENGVRYGTSTPLMAGCPLADGRAGQMRDAIHRAPPSRDRKMTPLPVAE